MARKRNRPLVCLTALLATASGLVLQGCGGSGTTASAPPAPPPPLSNRIYYVSPSGNDSNAGTSESAPWRTLAKVNASSLGPGDRVLLQGGQTFNGPIALTATNYAFRSDAPLTISSYGSGRATIRGDGSLGGVFIQNVGAVVLKNLNLVGIAANNGTNGIVINNEINGTLSIFRVEDVEIRQFTHAIYVAASRMQSQLQDIRLERVKAHQNAIGPGFYGFLDRQSAFNNNHFGIKQVVVRQCELHNNDGAGLVNNWGAGLVMMNVDEPLIESTVVYDNGGNNPATSPNAVSAMTIYDVRNATIQENEIYGQRFHPSARTDSAGLDLSGRNCIVQYNYFHDGENWGFLSGSSHDPNTPPGSAFVSEDITVRYNIFENNARPRPGTPPYLGASLFLFGSLKNYHIYNNTIYSAGRSQGGPEQGIISLHAGDEPGSNVTFRNNAFIALEDVMTYEVWASQAWIGLRFENNAYINTTTTTRIRWGSQLFTSVSAWANSSGQESGRAFVQTDPSAFLAAGRAGTVFPGSLRSMSAYQLTQGSRLIDTGRDLRQAHGWQVGSRDFLGSPIPSGGGFDIGAIERP